MLIQNLRSFQDIQEFKISLRSWQDIQNVERWEIACRQESVHNFSGLRNNYKLAGNEINYEQLFSVSLRGFSVFCLNEKNLNFYRLNVKKNSV